MTLKKRQVIIAYSEKLFSDGIVAIIETSNNYAILDKVPLRNGLHPLLQEKKQVDVLIIEQTCPGHKDLEYIADLVETFPDLKILLISHLAKKHISSKLIESGIDGYLLKSCSKQDLFTALNKIAEGHNYFCSDITKSLLISKEQSLQVENVDLTLREKEILTMLVNCKTNAQIAKHIGLSENTVKTHRRNIQVKFGVNNLVGMIRFACKTNMIDFGKDDFCAVCPHCADH